MTSVLLRLTARAVLLAAAGATLAAPPAETRAQLEQRLRLTASLLADSAAARRIDASGDAAAVAHLDEGRVHHALAMSRLEQGDLDGARRAVDEALHHMGMARRRVPDDEARRAAARQRHAELMSSLTRLTQAWRARVGDRPSAQDVEDMTAASGLVAQSHRLAETGRHEEAIAPLVLAQQHVLSGVNRLLHVATLDYTERSASPEDAYRIELARHAGLSALVPLALKELRPEAGALALIERYGQASETLHEQAQRRFGQGDVPRALEHLRSATLYLQRALGAAGVVTPGGTGLPP